MLTKYILLLTILGIFNLTNASTTIGENPQATFDSKEQIICTAIYKPICGYDMETEDLKTFPNQCHIDNDDKFGYLHFGECIADNLSELRQSPDNYLLF